MKELEEMTSEIGRGNLDARVNIETGDEFEKLGHAFNTMAKRLTEGRDLLEEKISQATHELSEANRELQTLDKLKSDFLANMYWLDSIVYLAYWCKNSIYRDYPQRHTIT